MTITTAADQLLTTRGGDPPYPPKWATPPQAPPMAAPLRAVDSWTAVRTGEKLMIIARAAVRGDVPGLPGLPGGPVIFPDIFVIETLCQAMALAVPGPTATLACLRSVRYFAPVPGGDELTLRITAVPRVGGGWDVSAEGSRRDGTKTARMTAEFGPAAMSPRPSAADSPAAQNPPGAPPDHRGLRALLPQRHPLLLVDRVLHLDPGRSIRTIKAISGSEPCYAHIQDGAPGRCYAYPRSLMIGSFGQSAMLLWQDGRVPPAADGRLLLGVGAKNYRFEGTAHPGDVLRHEVRLDYEAADTAFTSGETWIGDRRVASVAALITTRRALRRSATPRRAPR